MIQWLIGDVLVMPVAHFWLRGDAVEEALEVFTLGEIQRHRVIRMPPGRSSLSRHLGRALGAAISPAHLF